MDVQWLENQALVDVTIQPGSRGRVQYSGSRWPAVCNQPVTLTPGATVYVVGRTNITLLVQPVHPSDSMTALEIFG